MFLFYSLVLTANRFKDLTEGNFSTSVSAAFLLKISLLEMLIAVGNEQLKKLLLFQCTSVYICPKSDISGATIVGGPKIFWRDQRAGGSKNLVSILYFF